MQIAIHTHDTDAALYHRVFADVTLAPDRYPNIARVVPRFVRLDAP